MLTEAVAHLRRGHRPQGKASGQDHDQQSGLGQLRDRSPRTAPGWSAPRWPSTSPAPPGSSRRPSTPRPPPARRRLTLSIPSIQGPNGTPRGDPRPARPHKHALNPAAAPPPRSKAQRSPDGGSGLRHLAGRDAARAGRLLGPCRLRRSQCAKDTRDTTVNSRTIVLTMP